MAFRKSNDALVMALLAAAFVSAISALELRAQDSSSKERTPKTSKLASVVRVDDDGRIVLKTDDKQRTVTLIGVEWPADDAADEAREYLERLLLGESVIVDEPAENSSSSKPATGDAKADDAEKAVYLRRAPDRLFVNVELLRLGYARVLAKPSFAQLADFREAEKKARDAGKGVWSTDEEGRPREVRRTRAAPENPADDETPRVAKKADGDGKSSGAEAGNSVYVTPSGKKYHRSDCRFAAKAKPLSLRDAIEKGYTPCSRCKPPSR